MKRGISRLLNALHHVTSSSHLRIPLDWYSVLLQGTLYTKLGGNTLNPVEGIKTFVTGNHPNTGRPLAGDNNGGCKEIFPDLKVFLNIRIARVDRGRNSPETTALHTSR